MLSVCRLCARWAKCVASIDDLQLNNLQHAKDAVKQMFDLDLSCPPPYPNHVCLECVQYLEYSYIFHQQLLNAEKVFQTLQERGELTQQLLEMKNAGDALQFAEMVEDEPGSELPKPDSDESYESVDLDKDNEQRNATTDEEDSIPIMPSERVIEIKIEAIEELEIVSCPLETVDTDKQQSSKEITSSAEEDEDENHSPDVDVHRTQCRNRTKNGFNESRRKPMTVTVPPEQKANRKVDRNKCYVCYRSYGTEAELMAHLIKHNNLLPYRCQQCSTPAYTFEFRTNQALNKHLETHWYPFECAECRLRFKKKDKINDHLRNVHMFESWYTCQWCGLKYKELFKFRLHVAAHRNMESGRSQKINNQFEYQKRLHPHSGRLNMRTYCKRRFQHSSNCEQRKQYSYETEQLFKCTEISCSKMFSSFREWRRHVKKHFPNESVYLKRAYMLPESL